MQQWWVSELNSRSLLTGKTRWILLLSPDVKLEGFLLSSTGRAASFDSLFLSHYSQVCEAACPAAGGDWCRSSPLSRASRSLPGDGLLLFLCFFPFLLYCLPDCLTRGFGSLSQQKLITSFAISGWCSFFFIFFFIVLMCPIVKYQTIQVQGGISCMEELKGEEWLISAAVKAVGWLSGCVCTLGTVLYTGLEYLKYSLWLPLNITSFQKAGLGDW